MNLQENIYRIRQVMGLNEDYSEKIVSQLVDKFKKEVPEEDDNFIRGYIERFDEIKNGPNIKNKDIFSYTFGQLEDVIHNSIADVKPKSYKGNTNMDLLLKKDGLEIYKADSRQKCIRYGDGYNFCISSHGPKNLYGDYRIKKSGTPFFVFDRNLNAGVKNDDGDKKTFIDPNHLIVIFVFPVNDFMPEYSEFNDSKKYDESYFNQIDYYYTVTDANNDGDKYYMSFDSVEKRIPSLKNLDILFNPIPLSDVDEREKELEENFEGALFELNDVYTGSKLMTDKCGFNEIEGIFMYYRLIDFGERTTLKAYDNKQYITYYLKTPDNDKFWKSNEYFFGNNGRDMAQKRIEELIGMAKISIDKNNQTMFPNYGDMDYWNAFLNQNNYEIIPCEWTKEFIEYVGKLNRLVKRFDYEKWRLIN